MKTLRELGIEPSRDLIDRMEGRGDPLGLTQAGAVREECGWEFGDPSWYSWFVETVNRYGGTVAYSEAKWEALRCDDT